MAGYIRDRSQIPRVIQVINELRSTYLKVGIFAPEGSEEWLKAIVNEYGATITVTPRMRAYLHYTGLHLRANTRVIRIPERSFIRAGYDENKDEFAQLIQRGLPAVISLNLSPQDFYEIIGNYIVGKLHEYVQRFSTPPNHPYTIARKGSSHPLIDTSAMNQKITYLVVRR